MKEKFILKANEVHSNFYSYNTVEYKNTHTPVTLLCPNHGEFIIRPEKHLRGRGCPECKGFIRTKSQFIKKANSVHKNKYDYSLVEFNSSTDKVIIKCLEHGIFHQTSNNHLQGQGCKKCGHIKRATEKIVKGGIEFIDKAIQIHGKRYDYSKVQYLSAIRKVKITCNKHGQFHQTPNSHLCGRGCPKCYHIISKPEEEIVKLLENKGYAVISNNRTIIKPLEIDIYLPELNKAIEFNGTYWHYDKKFFIPGKHGKKSQLCREKSINLLHLRQDLWQKDKEKMKQIIIKFVNLEKLHGTEGGEDTEQTS